jgi:hypothetical protein
MPLHAMNEPARRGDEGWPTMPAASKREATFVNFDHAVFFTQYRFVNE